MSRLAGFCLAMVVGVAAMPGMAQEKHFQLSSPAFADNGLMAKKFAGKHPSNPNCVGGNVSPPLQWSNPPPGTKSFSVLLHDQEGRKGLGVVHWVVYGIPASASSLAEGAGEGRTGLVGGKNILDQGTYLGPCPPKGTGPHHYVFTLVATDLEPGALKPGLTMQELLQQIGSHALGATGLVGRFGH